MAEVRQELTSHPKVSTVTMDVKDGMEVDDFADLLTKNYVEDDDNMFRFDYSRASRGRCSLCYHPEVRRYPPGE